MDCQYCTELNQLEFEKKTCNFKNRRELFLLLLLNTLLSIKYFNDKLYYCEDGKECLICKIEIIYTDFEYDLYKDMFDLNHLIECHSNLYHYLNQLF